MHSVLFLCASVRACVKCSHGVGHRRNWPPPTPNEWVFNLITHSHANAAAAPRTRKHAKRVSHRITFACACHQVERAIMRAVIFIRASRMYARRLWRCGGIYLNATPLRFFACVHAFVPVVVCWRAPAGDREPGGVLFAIRYFLFRWHHGP